MKQDLSERENEFMVSLLNFAEKGNVTRIERGDLYALANIQGFSEREVYRYAMELDLRGYVRAQPILGGKIASISLTAPGIDYARKLEGQKR